MVTPTPLHGGEAVLYHLLKGLAAAFDVAPFDIGAGAEVFLSDQ